MKSVKYNFDFITKDLLGAFPNFHQSQCPHCSFFNFEKSLQNLSLC